MQQTRSEELDAAASTSQAPGRIRSLVMLAARLAVVGAATLLAIALVPLTLGWRATVVASGSMSPAIERGDVVLYRTVAVAAVQPGVVVVTDRPGVPGGRRIHRVTAIDDDGSLRTRGDANTEDDSDTTPPEGVRGRAGLRVPWIGFPTLWVREGGWLQLAATAIVTSVLVALARRPRADGTAVDETAVDETAVDETAVDETAVDETAVDETTAHNTTAQVAVAYPPSSLPPSNPPAPDPVPPVPPVPTAADAPPVPPAAEGEVRRRHTDEAPAAMPAVPSVPHVPSVPTPVAAPLPVPVVAADVLAGRVTLAHRWIVAVAGDRSATVAWRRELERPASLGPAESGDLVAVAIDDVVIALDRRDGTVRWRIRLPEPPVGLVGGLLPGVDGFVAVLEHAAVGLSATDGGACGLVTLPVPARHDGHAARIGDRLAYSAAGPAGFGIAVVDLRSRKASRLVLGRDAELGGRIAGVGERLVVGATPGTTGPLMAIDLTALTERTPANPANPGVVDGGAGTCETFERRFRWSGSAGQPLGVVAVPCDGSHRGLVLIRTDGGVDGIDLDTGATRWRAPVHPATDELLDVGEGRVALTVRVTADAVDLVTIETATGDVTTGEVAIARRSVG